VSVRPAVRGIRTGMGRTSVLAVATVVVAVLASAWQRTRAVQQLPQDFDELTYLPAAYDYAERMAVGDWAGVAASRTDVEHPPLVKLLFATGLMATDAAAPDWKALRVGRPLPERARPAFQVTRALSAVTGVLQVALTGLVHPVGALLLAFDVYHVKDTAQAYLEAVPGLLALLSVLAFERALRGRGDTGGPLARGWLAAAGVLLGLAAAGKSPDGLRAASGSPGCPDEDSPCPRLKTVSCALESLRTQYTACTEAADCVQVQLEADNTGFSSCPRFVMRTGREAFTQEAQAEVTRSCGESPTCRSSGSRAPVAPACVDGRCTGVPVTGP
jgi:hypothetical protein